KTCRGARLRPESLGVRVADGNISEYVRLSIREALPVFRSLPVTERERPAALSLPLAPPPRAAAPRRRPAVARDRAAPVLPGRARGGLSHPRPPHHLALPPGGPSQSSAP